MNTPSRHKITRSTPPASRPPELPPVGNIEGSGNVASECPDSDQGGSGDVDAFVDDFLASLPTHVEGGEGKVDLLYLRQNWPDGENSN